LANRFFKGRSEIFSAAQDFIVDSGSKIIRTEKANGTDTVNTLPITAKYPKLQ
jgi:hypothetical protein